MSFRIPKTITDGKSKRNRGKGAERQKRQKPGGTAETK